jgi:hypothetical protein
MAKYGRFDPRNKKKRNDKYRSDKKRPEYVQVNKRNNGKRVRIQQSS